MAKIAISPSISQSEITLSARPTRKQLHHLWQAIARPLVLYSLKPYAFVRSVTFGQAQPQQRRHLPPRTHKRERAMGPHLLYLIE